MKKRRNKFFDIRVQFFFICMAGFIGVALLAALAAWGLEHLGVNVPMFVWLLIFTLLLGSATAAGFSIAFFAPISRLSRAMKEVAGGNFRVHVETKSVFRDIRDSFDSFNLMVSELNATETLQTDFISNVSHEFKTPISAIEGYASLLQEHQQSPEEQAEYIDKILFNTRRLSALAGNILLLSKLDSQSIHPQRSRFRLDEQVRQCILALERKWTEKDVDFDVDLDSVDFTGYEGLLQHVWMNLIDNAVKFGPRGGLIRMRLIELFTMLSKAALDSGINLNKILAAGLDPLEALNQAQSVEELAVWTQKLIDHFFSLVPEPPAPVYSPLITQAIELIGERYAEKLTLRDVAGSIHINESYLSKLFKKELGVGFTDYLNSLRIQKSVELLSQPDMNLLEIAGRVGFDDQSYFTKVFKKITGKTPRQFKVSAGADKLLDNEYIRGFPVPQIGGK